MQTGPGKMRAMKRHEWHERTEEGEKRTVRATRQGGGWKLQSRTTSEPEWHLHDPPLREDLEELLEVLRRKYQRGRTPYEHIVELERVLKQ